ncbi:hypothetical protein KR038_007026 [Drosophila bunnanda]|nr:hypothetical protein KR038_007026 [Drosophila bunnanda]
MFSVSRVSGECSLEKLLAVTHPYVWQVHCAFEFTNVNCSSLDSEFMGVDTCHLKSVNRSYKYLSFRSKFYKLPVNNVTVSIEVLKRLNGYKPFLFNFTFDACKFLRGQRSQMLRFFYELFAPYSNMVHPCPYNHDIYVEKLPISYLNHRLTNVLPVPEGKYCVHSVYFSSGKPVFDLKVYVDIS